METNKHLEQVGTDENKLDSHKLIIEHALENHTIQPLVQQEINRHIDILSGDQYNKETATSEQKKLLLQAADILPQHIKKALQKVVSYDTVETLETRNHIGTDELVRKVILWNLEHREKSFRKCAYFNPETMQAYSTLESGNINASKKIINLHGLVGSVENFTQQHQDHKLPNTHMISLDIQHSLWQAPQQKNNDTHSEQSIPYHSDDIEGCVGFVHDFVSYISGEAVHMHGVSIGGQVAYTFAHRYPEKTVSLICSGASGLQDDTGALSKVQQLALKSTSLRKRAVPMIVNSYFYNKDNIPQSMSTDILNLLDNKQARNRLKSMAESTKSMKKDQPKILEALGKTNIPVLLINGAKDKIVTVPQAQKMSQLLSGSTLHIVQNSNHTPNMDTPGIYNNYFWKRIQSH